MLLLLFLDLVTSLNFYTLSTDFESVVVVVATGRVAWLGANTASHATNDFVTIAHEAIVTSAANVNILLLLTFF